MAHPLKAILGGHAVAHFPTLGKIYGSNAALLLSSLCFWEGKGVDPDWSYKPATEIYDETGLTDNEQITARRRLVKSGVITEERRGIHRRMWYKVNWDTLQMHLSEFAKDANFKVYADKRRANKPPKHAAEVCPPNNGDEVPQNMGDKSPILRDTIQIDPELPTSETKVSAEDLWNAIPSAADAPITDNGLIAILPEEVHLFAALNLERAARHYAPFVRFKTTKQREKFRGCVEVFNGSTNKQVDEIIANGKTDIEGVVNALDWRRRNHTKNMPQAQGFEVKVQGDGSFYG